MFFSQHFSFPLSVPFHHCYISPVSTIPPLLHTHPSIYHSHCIMFFSQHFRFPLSVPFHHCYISPVSTNPPLLHFSCQYHSTIATFPLSVAFHHCYTSPVSTIQPLLYFPCQYHSTIATFPLSVPFYYCYISPVSIIPPLLHTHPSIYHRHCIMFFPQHFSFPLSVPFHHCSILIHPSTTDTVQCFSPSTSISPVSTILPLLHFPRQYHSTIATFPLSVPFQHCYISLVSTIPTLLHNLTCTSTQLECDGEECDGCDRATTFPFRKFKGNVWKRLPSSFVLHHSFFFCRSQCPRVLRRRSASARLPRLRFRIPSGVWISVCCCVVCCRIEVCASG